MLIIPPKSRLRSTLTTTVLPRSSTTASSSADSSRHSRTTCVSSPSTVSTSIVPCGIARSSPGVVGVEKVRSIIELLSALAEAGQTPAPVVVAARLGAATQGVDDPGVDGDALACGGVLDARLQAFGQPQRDARGRRLVGRRRGGVVVDDDELWLGTGEADVDAGAVELRIELERRLAQCLEQPPGERRLERDGQEVGGSGRRLVTDGGDSLEILLQRLHVAVDLHGATM